jgi:hypothetical protein
MDQKIETDHIQLELVEDMLYLTFKPGLKVDEKIAESIISSRLEFIKGKSYPTLIDGRKLASMDKVAREKFSSDSARMGVKAGAILIDSVFSTFLANFFMKVTLVKPKIPTQLFTDRSKAIEWLKNFK